MAALAVVACRGGAVATGVRPVAGPAASGPPLTTEVPASGPRPTSGLGVVVSPSGVVLPVLAEAKHGWVVRTPCGARRTIAGGTRVGGATVVLDAGHGGAERGAVAPSGLAEAPVNLEVARHARAVLEREGVSVQLTRTGDYQMELEARALVATSLSPRAFVSIHHNSVPDGPRPGPGTETYYQQASPDSKRLAGLIYEEVVGALSAYQVSWVADTDAGAKYRPGSRGDYYAMLRMPGVVTSVLAELAFISNPAEAELLARPDVRAVEGAAVARGILRYLRTSEPGSGFTIPYPRVDPPSAPGEPPTPCVDPPL